MRSRLRRETLNREILAISVPAIITNITTPILGLVDIAIAGHFKSAAYIGAIAVGSSIFNMIYWLLNFLRAGTSGLTAQAFGEGNREKRDLILSRGLSIGFLLGLITLAFSPLLSYVLIPFMEADADTSALAERYFSIVIWGAPAYISSYAISGWLLGCQNSVATLKIALITNIINILLSLTFVWVFYMKIEGIALGTAISQWIGAIYGFYLIKKKYKTEKFPLKRIFNSSDLKRFFRINSDIFLRTGCLVAVTIWFTRSGASLGPEILAANSLLMQFFMLFSFFMDGFAYAAEALGGKYFGVGNKEILRQLIKKLLYWGIGIAIIGMTIYFFIGEWILSILTDEESVRNVAKDFLPWAITIPLMGFMAFIYDGFFIGLTLTRKMLVSMFLAMIVFFISYFLLRNLLGNHALWLAFSLYLLTRGFCQMWLMRSDGI